MWGGVVPLWLTEPFSFTRLVPDSSHRTPHSQENSDLGTRRQSNSEIAGTRTGLLRGEKHLGSVISCIRTGDPSGKYFRVLWDSLDSDEVGVGDGWV